MEEKLPVGLDCDHYKMLTIEECPLDSWHCRLDALCFPSLFPTGQFGQHHHQDVKLQYAKSPRHRAVR